MAWKVSMEGNKWRARVFWGVLMNPSRGFVGVVAHVNIHHIAIPPIQDIFIIKSGMGWRSVSQSD